MALLEVVFSADSFPTFTVRAQLASQLGIDPRQVQIWFQNRRQRERSKMGKSPAVTGDASPSLPATSGSTSTVSWPDSTAPLSDAVIADPLAEAASEVPLCSSLGEPAFPMRGASVIGEAALPNGTTFCSCTFGGSSTGDLSAGCRHVHSGADGAGVPAGYHSISVSMAPRLPVLPDAAPAAMHQMLDTPGGARALAAAAVRAKSQPQPRIST